MKKWSVIVFLLPVAMLAQNFSNLAGARSSALSHSSVAFTDVWAGHHNQAGLAFLEKTTFGVSYEQRYLLKDLAQTNAAFAMPTEFGTLGLSLSYFGFELYHQSKFGLNYSRSFGKYFAVGLQLNYHDYYVEEGIRSPGTLSFETGLLAKPTKALQIGFHLFNPSRSFKNVETEERLPLIGRLGARYEFSKEVALSAEVKKEEGFDEQYAVGFEWEFVEHFFFRTGFGLQPLRNTFGLGLELSGFTANLSYEYAQVLGNNAGLGLQYQF